MLLGRLLSECFECSDSALSHIHETETINLSLWLSENAFAFRLPISASIIQTPPVGKANLAIYSNYNVHDACWHGSVFPCFLFSRNHFCKPS